MFLKLCFLEHYEKLIYWVSWESRDTYLSFYYRVAKYVLRLRAI